MDKLRLLTHAALVCAAIGPIPARSQTLSEPATVAVPAGATWKTAYVKRGFVGNYKAEWAGGVGATLRSRVVLPFVGTHIRVYLRSAHNVDAQLSRLALSRGVDEDGTTDGSVYPVTFAGLAGVNIPQKARDITSDEVAVPLLPGPWYVQSTYSSPEYQYAYERDTFFAEMGAAFEKPKLKDAKKGSWPGNLFRIDVLTTDKRPTILCYGDSITAGYGSTPNRLTRYPDVLAKLLDRPVLNLGGNGDVLTYTGGLAGQVKELKGVDTVVVLMGINDLIGGRITTLDKYQTLMRSLAAQLKGAGYKFFVGTLPPASGWKGYDDKPETENLRVAINQWIKADLEADEIIDFDKVLADPANPARFLPAYQMDWLHPSDEGYQKMAEAAAAVLRKH